MTVRRIGWLTVLVTLAHIGAQAAPNETGDLRVTVLTEEGSALAGAGVVVEARDGRTWQATTDADGVAVLGLVAGFYRVVAAHTRHIQVVEPAVRVVRNKPVPVEMVLRARRSSSWPAQSAKTLLAASAPRFRAAKPCRRSASGSSVSSTRNRR